MAVISSRIDNKTRQLMKKHDEINWSAVIRRSIETKIKTLDEKSFDYERAQKALDEIHKIAANYKSEGKTTTELIREWRDKRRL